MFSLETWYLGHKSARQIGADGTFEGGSPDVTWTWPGRPIRPRQVLKSLKSARM
jgi:hypothetical protein